MHYSSYARYFKHLIALLCILVCIKMQQKLKKLLNTLNNHRKSRPHANTHCAQCVLTTITQQLSCVLSFFSRILLSIEQKT
jgi:hypothetical protein